MEDTQDFSKTNNKVIKNMKKLEKSMEHFKDEKNRMFE